MEKTYIDEIGLPRGWKRVRFDEVIKFLTDFQANGSFAGLKENVRYYSESNYAVLVRLKDLRNNLNDEKSFVYTDKKGYDFLKKSKVTEGDILVANVGAGVGTTLKMPPFNKRGTLGPNMFRVDLKDMILKNFFLAFTGSVNYWHQLNLVSAGSGQPKINKSQYKSIEIPLPPIETQHAIVSKIEELLSELDKGKQQLELAQQQLKVYRQAVLKWAFEGKLTNKDVKEGELPEGWEHVELRDISELITKGASPKWQGINYVDDASQVLFVTSENVRENYIDISEPKYLEIGFNVKQRRSILKKGDILLNIVGASIGRAAIFDLERNANINQAVSVIRLNNKAVKEYVCYFLNSNVALSYYNLNKVDFARANLSLADVSNLPLALPSVKGQQNIVLEIESRLSVCDKLEETINQSLTQAETLRQSILKKAFEGKLV